MSAESPTVTGQATMPLGRLAKLIRSKNAGPFMLTVDVLFDDVATFGAVVEAKALDVAVVSDCFGVPEADIQIHIVPPALAIKVSLPRPVPSGAVEDSDVFGGQQFAPLVELPVTVPVDLPAVVARRAAATIRHATAPDGDKQAESRTDDRSGEVNR